MKWLSKLWPFPGTPEWKRIQREKDSLAVGMSRLYPYGGGKLRVTRLAGHSWTFERVTGNEAPRAEA